MARTIAIIPAVLFAVVLAGLVLVAGVAAIETEPGDLNVTGTAISADCRWTPDRMNIETAAVIAADRVLQGSARNATREVAVVEAPVVGATTDGTVSAVAAPPGPATVPGGAYATPADPVRRALDLDGDPVITSVSPQIASAGTNTTITITGTGFGEKGSGSDVGFTSYGGVYWASGRTSPTENVNEIVSWSDTEVRVRVPTGFSSDGYAVSASSGEVWVVTDGGPTSVPVPFAVSFGVGGEKWAAGPVFLVNDNCPGVTGGAAAVRRAAATWNTALPETYRIDCSGTSGSTEFGNDGVSLIAWGESNQIIYWYNTSTGTIVEADIILDSSMDWTTGVAGGSVYSIESRVLNGLGFCLGIAALSGETPQGPSDTGKVSFLYQADVYGTMNQLSLHPADRAAAAYLYNGGSANPDLLAAAFTADTIAGPAPLAVRFGDASLGGATGWAWDFGDGGASTERNPTHAYAVPGTYTVTLTASAAGHPSDTIRAIDRIRVAASVAALPGGAGTPSDTDADGLYDDVNGNGRKDFADVVLYFNQMTWIATNEPTALFDYNANGRIDFADVVWLFNHL